MLKLFRAYTFALCSLTPQCALATNAPQSPQLTETGPHTDVYISISPNHLKINDRLSANRADASCLQLALNVMAKGKKEIRDSNFVVFTCSRYAVNGQLTSAIRAAIEPQIVCARANKTIFCMPALDPRHLKESWREARGMAAEYGQSGKTDANLLRPGMIRPEGSQSNQP